MLAAMLASHPQFAAGPETQFFSKLPMAELELAARPKVWPMQAVAMLSRLTLAEQPVLSLFGTDEAEITSFLERREPSVSAMLESLVMPFAAKRTKPRWVEKTPNHICNLDLIRQLWPTAAIIRIVRDPRDVALSMRKLPTFSNQPLPNIYIWREWNLAAERFFETDAQAISVRYEDIVDQPEDQLTKLCAFLGEEFDPAMLAFGAAAADVSSRNESWKSQVSERLSASRKYAWKQHLQPEHRQVADLVCHDLLEKYGYETSSPPETTRTAFRMSRRFIEQHEAVLIDKASRAERWLPAAEPQTADRIVDHPEYHKFRNPLMLGKLVMGQIKSHWERAAL